MPAETTPDKRLQAVAAEAKGEIIGLHLIRHAGHALVVETALRAFGDEPRALFVIETAPPRVGGGVGSWVPRPDLILCHPKLGCLTIEAKGLPLKAILGVCGTTLELLRGKERRAEDPFEQAERVSFRLRDLVKRRLRNLERQSQGGFSLPLSPGRFYPDFVAELNDGTIVLVEYKNAMLAQAESERHKKAIGELWASRGGGSFGWVVDRDWAALDRAFAPDP
ncbi:MAG: hypothetical protein AAF561_00885 [Planctomycetota bacterium]